MKRDDLAEMVDQNLSTRQIAAKVGCSQTNVRHWLRKHGLNTNHVAGVDAVCTVCEGALKGRQTKYCSLSCKNSASNSPGGSGYEAQRQRGRDRKLRLIQLLGGQCSECGYNTNYAALCFHHRNPGNKTFNVDIRKCSNTNWKSLLKEANKCDLLCHNCHAELHYPSCKLT